jgi:CubicO group peptidase (beta-lactamase class C family)
MLAMALMLFVTNSLKAHYTYIGDSIAVSNCKRIKIPVVYSNLIHNTVREFPYQTQLSLALIDNDKVTFYGVLIDNDTINVIENQDEIFEIGSITKVFTATVLANLVVNNELQLTDTINAYFSFPFNNNTSLRFLELANHTSGLTRLPSNFQIANLLSSNPYKDYSKTELEKYLEYDLQLAHNEPQYNYSNTGAGLLLYTLSLVQNESFETLFKTHVFSQYGMNHSYTNRDNLGDQLVNGLNGNGQETENWDFNILFGAGGILSCVSDLAQFVKAHFQESDTTLALTREPTFKVNENLKIGLGLHIIKADVNSELYWHNGGTGGYSSSMAFDVKSKCGVVILSNVSSFNPKHRQIDQLCFQLMKLLNNQTL